MWYELECNVRTCKRRVWCFGEAEDIENCIIHEDNLPDDCCEHIFEGDYTIIDKEEDSDE